MHSCNHFLYSRWLKLWRTAHPIYARMSINVISETGFGHYFKSVVTLIYNPIDKNIIFRYIHSILPDGEYLMKYHIIQNLPKCTMCHKGFYTLNHIFVKCNNFKQDRLEFKKNIRQINPLYIFNQIFYKCG